MNWGQNYTEAQVATLFTLMKANGVGVGDSDACPMRPDGTYTTDGSFPVYIDADNLIAGYGGYDTNHKPAVHTDQRGKMFIWGSVETSELGYNAVCGNPGMTGLPVAGYGALFNFWNDGIRASHVIVEKNTYIGTDAQRWKNAPNSLYDMVMNHPLTHTACPSDYDTQFGNGTAGSGCNTR
jgi:hypothetical protein